jgi:hypothetical protein
VSAAPDLISTGWVLGALLGMRHALEPDHIAAVSTLMTEQRQSRTAAVLLGACWGFGHSLSLLVVGVLLAALHAQLPPSLALAFEVAVVLMLIGLGLRALRSAWRPAAHVHAHPRLRRRFAGRSLIYGVIHGLAGSGALTALVIANLPSLGARVGYIALFGFGSMVGMATLSGLAGLSLSRLAFGGRAGRLIGALTGTFSIALGIAWAGPLIRQVF